MAALACTGPMVWRQARPSENKLPRNHVVGSASGIRRLSSRLILRTSEAATAARKRAVGFDTTSWRMRKSETEQARLARRAPLQGVQLLFPTARASKFPEDSRAPQPAEASNRSRKRMESLAPLGPRLSGSIFLRFRRRSFFPVACSNSDCLPLKRSAAQSERAKLQGFWLRLQAVKFGPSTAARRESRRSAPCRR